MSIGCSRFVAFTLLSLWIPLALPIIVAFLVTLPHFIIMYSHAKNFTRFKQFGGVASDRDT
jgi:hypothetical protein